MKKEYSHEGITWLDIEKPSQEEARALIDEHSVHPLVANDILSPTSHPYIENYGEFLYLVLHFPAFSHTENSAHTQEVDFIINKDTLITVRYGEVDALRGFSKRFETGALLEREEYSEHAGFLFFQMVRFAHAVSSEELERINSRIAEIENKIFNGEEHAMVHTISEVGRELLDFRRAFHVRRDTLVTLPERAEPLLGKAFVPYARSLAGERERIADDITASTETLAELRTTNDSLLSTKMNDIMRVLTIMAFITFPLTLITSVFGMNTETLPIVGQEGDFWIVIGIMTAATVGFFGFFKYKHWL